MNISGLTSLDPSRLKSPGGKTADILAGEEGRKMGQGDASLLAPVKAGAGKTPSPGGIERNLLEGRISLDLHFSLMERYSASGTASTAAGYMDFRAEVEKMIEADYSFDLSFLAKLDGTSKKLGGLDQGVLDSFVKEASDLMSLDPGELKQFLVSVDNLFNELKGVLGESYGSMDGARELLKSSVSGFIESVRGEVSRGIPPAPSPNDAPVPAAENGVGLPAPVSPSGGIDFKKLYADATAKFDESFYSFLLETMGKLSNMVADQHQNLLDTLARRGETPEDHSGRLA